MTTAVLPETLAVARVAALPRERRWRGRRLLAVALVLSVAIHLAFTLWPVEDVVTPDDVPLTATITEMPPPPVATPAPPAPKPRRKSPVARPAPASVAEPVEPAVAAPAEPPAAAPASAPVTAPVLAEDVMPMESAAPPSAKTLPPRVDLSYKVYFGTQGFFVGDATYRFEHSGNRYRIHTVGQARGLAAILLRGQGRIESRGLITAGGLQPYEFSFERGDPVRREAALFDWETGIVTLNDQKSAVLELPTYDVLALMWQYYFTPPEGTVVAFSLATTRRVLKYTITREGTEMLRWANGEIETERWHRRSDDGKTDALVWLAPSLRYLPVKLRVVNTERGTAEVLLDSIRVDAAGNADGWAPNVSGVSDVLRPAARTAVEPAPPTTFAPGATFPTNTGN